LSGGAPVLTFMAGALVALDERNVKFDVVSASGAGMLVGLLYAAPAGGPGKRQEALKNTVDMGVSDQIYDRFPVNFKVFHISPAFTPTPTGNGSRRSRRSGSPIRASNAT
jgi:NTE family protein